MTPDWSLKVAAFLNRPPDYALFPEGAEERAKELIQVALNGSLSPEDWSKITEISEIASGLDIPPFVKELDPNCFRENPLIINSLSGEEYPLSLPRCNEESVWTHIRSVVKSIKEEAGGDRRKLFLALWRLLPESLIENDETLIGPSWKMLPADPRVPSHTIWDHASIASAFAGAWPKPAILVFTLASVQEMVNTARRTQDAWMGSYLASYLCWQAIKVIAGECGPDAFIYPSLRDQPLADLWLQNEIGLQSINAAGKESIEIGNIPNVFTAIVPSDRAKWLAKAAEKAVKDWWKEEATESVREQAENAVKNDWGIDISSWKSIWDRQRENFIEGMGIFWVICPWGTNRTDHEEVISAWTKDNPMGFLTDLQKMLSDMKAAGYPPNVGMVYHLLSSFAGRGLTARKNLRNFTQIHEPGHKCSLCGKWEALHPKFSDLACTKQVTGKIKSEEIRNKPDEQSHSHRWLSAFWEALGEISRNGGQLKLKGRIRRGDRLCSFCLTRRLALEAFFVKKLGLDWHLFPSTAGIATAAYRGRILEEVMKGDLGLEQALDSYSEVIKKFILEQDLPYPAAFPAFLKEWAAKSKKGEEFLKIDGDWLFVSSFDLQALKRSYPIDSLKEIDAKKEVVRKLNQAAKNLGSPPRYYAILAVDADKMGDWLTSARAPWFRWLFHANLRDEDRVRPLTFPRPLGPALQLALSDSLKNFALYRVRRIVEKDHAGKLIYAGGDDALAFLPLEHLFHVMEKLYLSFRGRNNGFEIEGLEILRLMGGVRPGTSIDIPHRGITISMGVVIAHHTFPLYQAMQEVQKVLKEVAKGALGRNAFAIRLMRRSGEHTETGFCFTSQGSAKECDILEKMDKILEYFQEGTLSTRLPYEMAENRWAELSPDEDKYQGLDQARQNELVRITGRHTKIGFEKKTSGLILSLFKDLNKGIKGFDPHKDKDVQVDAWKTMSDFLQILRFITGKGE